MRRRTSSQAATRAVPLQMPRDVEAVEAVIDQLDRGVTNESHAHHVITETLVRELQIGYGAVWLVTDDGTFHLDGQFGPMTGAMATGPGGHVDRITARDGFGGEAIRTKQALVLDAESDPRTCLRWGGALSAGATSGCVLPLVEDGRVTALYEYYTDGELPFLGARQSKWDSLGRVLGHARRAALATAQLQETLDDRVAVTTVVTEVGAASDRQSALHIALDTVREAFGWAYGSYWALDESANVLRFQQESGSAGEEFRKVTLTASFAEGVG
ncbi:MAG: Methyl-accepting chemotaxis sensory transducer, partial [Modestobacter sp.]|nr:Methyl-accepting chemotaxis sensory transducer [Modestobacter sp.]